ncbi:hypothetical protein [Vreelandella alkaliphila]|uniref:hypothetical protein n=1 Tax=Vreelandella alkaliphila TaxID=272774 RepID=UPI003FD878CF
MTDSLSIKPILRLIAELPTEQQERLVLLGGQAIAFWGFHFFEGRLETAEAAALTSSDLDIAAQSKEGVRVLARAWEASATFPKADDQTPNMAVIELERPDLREGGGHFTIDVMSSVYGAVDASDLTAWSELIEWTLDEEAQEVVRFRVVSPQMLLWTRIANLQYRHMGEIARARELVRTKVLCEIVREHLTHFAQDTFTDSTLRRPALKHAAFVYRDIAKKKETRVVLANHPELIEPFMNAIPNSPFWPDKLLGGASRWQSWLRRRIETLNSHRASRKAIKAVKQAPLVD